MDHKAQIAVEFALILGLMVMFVLILISAAQNQIAVSDEVILKVESSRISQRIADSADQVYLCGSGCSTQMKVKENIYRTEDYNISLLRHGISIDYDKMHSRRFVTKTLARDLVGDIEPGDILLTNINGTIYLENI